MNGLVIFGLIAGVMIAILFITGMAHDAISVVAQTAGVSLPDDKLGWMDNAALSEGDRRRIAEISGQTYGDNLGVIRAIQSGSRGGVTRRDFELLRQDRRRAQAAYPDVDPEKLFTSGWFNVDFSARIPDSFCTSGNSNGTQGKDGKWYLDGGCYLSYVSPKYQNRTEGPAATAYLKALRERKTAERIEKLRTDGTFFSMGGTGGSLSVTCNPTKGCIVTQADEWARKGKRYAFPFVAEEWEPMPWQMSAIEKLPSFSQAIIEEIDVEPSGVSVGYRSSATTSTGRQFDGTLLPGESVGMGVTIPMQMR